MSSRLEGLCISAHKCYAALADPYAIVVRGKAWYFAECGPGHKPKP